MKLEHDGAEHFEAVVSGEQLAAIARQMPRGGRPGARISDLRPLRQWLRADGEVGSLAASFLGADCRPVRAILFDKSADVNWSLAWHQDRTIAVAEKASAPGFDRWTVKDGTPHVEPPFTIIEQMITARVHFDDVDAENAPLLVSPGTHLLGKIGEEQLAAAVEKHGEVRCLATAGDVWLYRTAIVHASGKAQAPRRRRVLQVDYSAADLPAPLRWAVTS